ncbi:MAG: phosphoribosylanthranilate isomerase [Brumimicrobium sp.]|nr:phosphoribosylanthranilate isomerase [Brumimicrobium sp.]
MNVKVCGMRDDQNIRKLVAHGNVNYLGLIFVPESPRCVTKPIGNTPVPIVGVFVNPTKEEVIEKTAEFNLDLIQLHGEESPDFVKEIHETVKPVIKTLSVAQKEDLDQAMAYEGCCQFFLFDTKTPLRGGSGKKFDWKLIDNYHGSVPFFLSGGISGEDAEEIKRISHPAFYGIDINSRFETRPGQKDIEQINTFIKKLAQ